MKRLFSIGFLLIFLFNAGGYYIVFWGLRNQAKNELIQQLNAQNYSKDQTIELSIPVNIPYQLNDQAFERVDGEFTYKGQVYRLVKQKFENGTLHIVCILSNKENFIANALSDFAKVSNDVPATSKQAVSLLAKLLKDYESNYALEVIHTGEWHYSISTFGGWRASLLTRDNPVYTPPPQIA